MFAYLGMALGWDRNWIHHAIIDRIQNVARRIRQQSYQMQTNPFSKTIAKKHHAKKVLLSRFTLSIEKRPDGDRVLSARGSVLNLM
jgi:hypothetical protein